MEAIDHLDLVVSSFERSLAFYSGDGPFADLSPTLECKWRSKTG